MGSQSHIKFSMVNANSVAYQPEAKLSKFMKFRGEVTQWQNFNSAILANPVF